jgi:transposase
LTPNRRGAFWPLPWCWMVIRGWVAAQAGGMDRQTLRDWVHRYNADGLTGLADRPRPGCQPRLTETQRGEVAEWVESGPDLKTDGVVRWRCADLRDRIAAKFHVHLHERSVAKLLKKLNFSSMSGRPVHPQSDLEAQEAFKKTLPGWRAPRSRGSLPAGRSKSGFRMKPASESQGTLTRIWAKRGTRPRIKLDRKFTWAYLFGAICPARGTGAALVMPTVLPLPPYAPELNSVENIWEYLRSNWFSHCVWDTYEAILDACCDAWNALMVKSEIITSIGTRDWAQVKI